jgi:hypothetical protein
MDCCLVLSHFYNDVGYLLISCISGLVYGQCLYTTLYNDNDNNNYISHY